MHLFACLLLSSLAVLASASPADEDSAGELLRRSAEAHRKGDGEAALKLADRAVSRDPKSVEALLFRGRLHEALRQYPKAVSDFDAVLKLQPDHADAINQRGSVRLCLGHIEAAVKDFDRFVELRPKEHPGHWKRGIALYHAGRFEEGAGQFAAYEQVDANDVENAVWHFLCTARANDVDTARKAILKIGHDKRVPLMEVYALFAGKAQPEDVLKAASQGAKGDLLKAQLFYAHLYLGLYWEAMKNPTRALEHMEKASGEHYVPMYMGEMARVHRDRLKAKRP